jgi:hypothetical protein
VFNSHFLCGFGLGAISPSTKRAQRFSFRWNEQMTKMLQSGNIPAETMTMAVGVGRGGSGFPGLFLLVTESSQF